MSRGLQDDIQPGADGQVVIASRSSATSPQKNSTVLERFMNRVLRLILCILSPMPLR